MVKIKLLFFLFIVYIPGVYAQFRVLPDSITFSGVVFNAEDMRPLWNATCRYGKVAQSTDEAGRFVVNTKRGDTICFTYVGFRPYSVVIPDTLTEPEYILGVFLSPDTIQLSEALILQRYGSSKRQNLINARNNMTGIMKQAYSPVREMDAEMNQKMMINEYARSVEMKGHVDVGLSVGLHSIDAYKLLRYQKKLKNENVWLNGGEMDMLKKIYYLEKNENKAN